jgi:hypothetical protein
VAALASLYDQPFDDAIVEGMLSFVRDSLATCVGYIGCESAPSEVLECLQAAVDDRPSWASRIAEVMADVVLPSCGATPVHVLHVRLSGCIFGAEAGCDCQRWKA